MNEEMVLNLGAEAIRTGVFLAGPLLLAAMVIGIVISVLQAVTQINEATLTFIPKMIGVVVMLVILAPWLIQTISEYTTLILGSAGDWVR